MQSQNHKTSRLDNWPERLAELIEGRLEKPFEWARNDCVTFACDAIEAVTGENPAEGFRGRYSTEVGARETVADYGPDLEAAVTAQMARLGYPEISLRVANRGDIALHDGPLGAGLGVLGMDGKSVLAPGPEGLRAVPLLECKRAWKVA